MWKNIVGLRDRLFPAGTRKGQQGSTQKRKWAKREKVGGVEKPVQEFREVMRTKQGASLARRGPEGRPKYRQGATLAL